MSRVILSPSAGDGDGRSLFSGGGERVGGRESLREVPVDSQGDEQSAELALFSGLPLILSAVADVLGGAATDALALRFGAQRASQIAGIAGYTLASFTMLLGTFMSTGSTAGLCIAIAGAFSMFTLAAAWSTAIRLGGPDAAVVSAIMNSVGQVGGILSPIVLAYVVDWTGNWNLPLRILAALYLVSALAWHWMRRLPADTA